MTGGRANTAGAKLERQIAVKCFLISVEKNELARATAASVSEPSLVALASTT